MIRRQSIAKLTLIVLVPAALLLAAEPAKLPRLKAPSEVVATFSIVACDLEKQEWGVAVQSKVLAVGSVVPYAKVKVGAIASQADCNTTYGPRGLEMLAGGMSAQEVVDKLTKADLNAGQRQLAIVDSQGRVATFTGDRCHSWCGSVKGTNYSCQGNILAGENVVKDMAAAFEQTEGLLADRLMAALIAGQKAGGDTRGEQSAGLLVVKENRGWGGLDDRWIDLRVDDHPHPITELKRVLDKKFKRSVEVE